MKHSIYSLCIKRALDLIFASAALFVFFPLLLFTSVLVRSKLGSPILFKQSRPGRDVKIFQLYKFRSMTNDIDEDGKLLPDYKRLTKFGSFLRSSSIDELPELINIIKGDMSIVGPRPLSIYYLPHYSSEQRKRHRVRPGLTGLAQINGRNNLDWDKRFELDVAYANNISFVEDLKIIIMTVIKVLKRSDIVVRGDNAVKDFGPYCVLCEEGKDVKNNTMMTYSEIGSYFWFEDSKEEKIDNGLNWLPDISDSSFTFSGRSAIEMALVDILNHHHKISKIYAPSYCCVSMLQSFFDHDIKVEFYEIEFADNKFVYKLPKKIEKNAIAMVMSYFGINLKGAHEAVNYFHQQGALVIEDISHSVFSENCYSELSDYLVIALRKWFPIPTGGWVGKVRGKLSAKPDMNSEHAVVEKIQAMKKKTDYIQGIISDKNDFLLENSKFENDLIHVDRMLKIDQTSEGFLDRFDIDGMKKKRRENCRVLLDGLASFNGKDLSLPEINLETVTPLFLPVFISSESKRDSLRSCLISNNIYCPVHWPEVMGASVGCREKELSLICDQRYSTNDMQVIVDAIQEFLKNNKEE